MKSPATNPDYRRLYDLSFVLLLIVSFLFVMIMTFKQQSAAGFAESFFQKDVLIKTYNHLRLQLGDQVFNNVLVGEHGWLEYSGGGNLDDYQNANLFSPKDLRTLTRTIRRCQDYAREQDITLLMIVAPNKATIYSENVPKEIQPLSQTSRFDQLNQYLQSHNASPLLDLRPALRAASKEQETYYPAGSHWNTYGAYIAYQTILETLSQEDPRLVPYPVEFFQFRTVTLDESFIGNKDLAALIQAEYLAPELAPFPTRKVSEVVSRVEFPNIYGYHQKTWIEDTSQPSLVMFHDSFGIAQLNEYLSWNFSTAYFIHQRSSALFLNKESLKQFSPDILIYQIAERNLQLMLDDLAGCAAE